MEKNEIPTPEQFAWMMRGKMGSDLEGAHVSMDDLMVELLRKLGYGEAMDIFDTQDKWYA